MGWRIGVAVIGVFALGWAAMALDQRRQQQRARLPRPEIDRWEEEGGAVPAGTGQTTAQTAPAAAVAHAS
jgi:hypothetical protein